MPFSLIKTKRFSVWNFENKSKVKVSKFLRWQWSSGNENLLCCTNTGCRTHTKKKRINCIDCRRSCPFSFSPPSIDRDLFELHLEECNHRIICCGACHQETPAMFLETHQAKSCEMSSIQCDHCWEQLRRVDLSAHQLLCMGETECDLCGTILMLKDLKIHKEDECVNKTVFCSVNFGHFYKCDHFCQRARLKDHMEDEDAIAIHEVITLRFKTYVENEQHSEELGFSPINFDY